MCIRDSNSQLRKMLQQPHFFLGQGSPHAAREILFGEAGVVGTVELDDFVAEVFEDAPDESVSAGMNFDFYFALGEAFYKMETIRLDAVSYTHLDVYKRQI